MALEEFDFSKNYNFSGVFWFENEFNSRFSGTLEYTPEKGIKLLLVSTVLNGTDYLLLRDFCAIQKMYGTLQYEGKSVNITLLDIVLGERSNTFGGNGCSRTFEGSARFLILDILLKTNRIKSLNIEYDDNFKSIFFYHISPEEVVEVQPYTKNAVRLSNANISFDVFYMSTPFYSADQLDDMLCDTIWHTKKSPMKELKEIVSKFLETHQHEIGIRKKTRSVVKIKSRSSDLRKYIEIENKWRSFFELIIDKPIIIKNASIGVDCISVDNRKYSTQKAILFQQYPIPTRKGANWRKFHLPISIDAFVGKNDLSKLQLPYEKWNQLYDDKKWTIIVNGIKSIIYKNDMIGNEDFIILISYIQTVLNILGYKTDNIDQLISKYADEKWIKEVRKLLQSLPKDKTIGQKISELRNSIAHPKSAEKDNGKYFAVITDYILMQKIYGYLAGLFIKMVLLHLYNFDKTNLEKYIDRFIKTRSGITRAKYDKDYATYKERLEKEIQKKKKLTPLPK
ncbi:MAG: hypothetical protein V8R89_05655 [Alphaproteobacteria bacterium]|mgnify:FL=1